MATTKIQWSEQVWNPVSGCTIKSSGCTRCYAMRMAGRLEAMGQEKYRGVTKKVNGKRIWSGLTILNDDALMIPLRRKKPTTWFVNSMSDLFWGDDEDLAQARKLGIENPKPIPFDFIDKVFAVMSLCPQHTFQILTKRMERMGKYLGECFKDTWTGGPWNGCRVDCNDRINEGISAHAKLSPWKIRERWPLPNVWLGTSVENQATADERIPHLLRCPAAIRFLSCEPLLGPINLRHVHPDDNIDCLYGWNPNVGPEGMNCQCVDWVIVGGESGPGARECDIAWIRGILSSCDAARVPCFVKQVGARPIYDPSHQIRLVNSGLADSGKRLDSKGGDPSEWPADLRVRQLPPQVQRMVER